jgi:hypothetical protein
LDNVRTFFSENPEWEAALSLLAQNEVLSEFFPAILSAPVDGWHIAPQTFGDVLEKCFHHIAAPLMLSNHTDLWQINHKGRFELDMSQR